MKLVKSLNLALNILLHSKLRSWLTIIGIVIGVSAVVAIVSIGDGMQQNVQSRFSGLGADLITISPGGGRASSGFRNFGEMHGAGEVSGASSGSAKNLTKKDIQIIQSVENVQLVHSSVSSKGEVYYLGEKASVSVDGVEPNTWKEVTTSELESGRLLSLSDDFSAVVGSRIAKNTFKQPLDLNRLIIIEGKAFKVAGILKEGGGFGGEDDKIIIPIKTAREVLSDVGQEKFDSIIVKSSNAYYVDQVMADIDSKLMISRHLTSKKKDYRISSAKATQQRLSDITNTITLFLSAIAAVSLLVGAVGIANTMFTSVLEKTKEIGIMKSIGAKNSDILMIFVFNSALVGMVGGLLGIIFGSVISALLPTLGLRIMGGAGGGNIATVISAKLLILSLLISVVIGIIAGLIPAYRASKLKPVDALRYE